MASASLVFWLIRAELGAQPGFERIGDRPALLLADDAALSALRPRISLLDRVELRRCASSASLAIGAGPAAASS